MVQAEPGVRILRVSTLIETDAVGPEVGGRTQGAYLNGAATLETELSARELLHALLAIERALGRVREPGLRWGPRTIDLDLLTHGDVVTEEPDLVVPHPRLHEREFVLAPLAEIASDLRVPGLRRCVSDLLADLRRLGEPS